ncbi:MAG: hypothetical protein QHH14_13965 [Clostridiales bacterium]|nr:hypothetical protein [Clostridiales bacterium]
MFPQIKSASRLDIEIRNWVDTQVEPQAQVSARLVQARQQDLQRSFDFTGNIRPDSLSDLFLGASFTFHLILMKSSRAVLSQDLELKEVGQEYEETLSRISRATGGYSSEQEIKDGYVKPNYPEQNGQRTLRLAPCMRSHHCHFWPPPHCHQHL